MARAVPLHRSLLVRLLATSMLIAVCAVAATAWLTVQLTARAVTQERSRTLASDTDVYDAIIAYAATHDSWAGAEELVRRQASLTGTRIALTTPERQLIAASAPDAAGIVAASDVPTATVDALYLDRGIVRDEAAGRIDPRAVGPYRLTGEEVERLGRLAEQQVGCLRRAGIAAEVVELPSGRSTVRELGGEQPPVTVCALAGLLDPVPTERAPLAELTGRLASCERGPIGDVAYTITPEFAPRYESAPPDAETDGYVRECIEQSRRAQLRPYVAPAALLFVTGPAAPSPAVTLSAANALRIAGTALVILLLTLVVTVLAGRRLVRPLRALTDAARQPAGTHAPVPVTTGDEIGLLAAAFNDLSARRLALEQQRNAMVNDIAHELRTPLTNIRSWLETARDGAVEVDPPVLDLLVEEAVLLHHVVDDLRDIAALEAGSLRVHPEPTYVRDLLEQLLDAHRGGGGVTLVLAPGDDPEVSVDPVRLRQIVGNLVANAVRHTPPGGTVTVSLSLRPDRLVIAVADTGPGIATADLPRVFDRFWRADGSRSRETGGSGLGLPIARQLARAHGGDLTAASVPGSGATFTVVLPII